MGLYTAKTALLAGIIDYAGTFPPAALSLDAAFREAATFREWMQAPWLYSSRFALPVKVLGGLTTEKVFNDSQGSGPWLFSALGTFSDKDTRATLEESVRADAHALQNLAAWGYGASQRSICVSYDTKLPHEVLGWRSADECKSWLEPILGAGLSALPRSVVRWYFELPVGETALPAARCLAEVLRKTTASTGFRWGLKLRTGGAHVPSAKSIVQFLDLIQHDFAFKATQGLHAATTHGTAWGFVNLFLTLNFLSAYPRDKFSLNDAESCLASEDKREFTFKEDRVEWKEHGITLAQLEQSRKHHNGCFGSCSLREPDESLAETFG